MLTSRLLTGNLVFLLKDPKFEIALGWQNMWVPQNIFNVYSCLSAHTKACNQTMQNENKTPRNECQTNLMRGCFMSPTESKEGGPCFEKVTMWSPLNKQTQILMDIFNICW
jgi:hypothetical protein